ncbi:OmpA family protein [Roseovarius pelagicus]|uniref:OmpA family protein n=1 Tax=Roseovarius pelagicus TaxID=2980108 RepID=A0ABY6DDI6_9RHOB|nr:OmpA family protein [Roseovarius pelagicus]UXX84224.1 OmpA family protein [Roseovarius pelagicus]
MLVSLLVALCAGLSPVHALELNLPGNGTMSREVVRDPDTYLLPVGPWEEDTLPVLEVSGRVVQQAWRIVIEGITTLQVMRPLAAQLEAAGYETLLRCAGQSCGGFDFRFGTPVLPAPEMFVDLFDYRFLSARLAGPEGPEYVSLLVSRSSNTAYVQIIHVGSDGSPNPIVSPNPGARPVARPATGQNAQDNAEAASAGDPIAGTLVTQGHVILHDLEFDTGSATLGPGPFATVAALAAYLKSDPTRRIALVGHTDTVGNLDTNIALSRRRAASVMNRLAETYEVPRAQLEAEGMGYLSPVAPNLTAEGREANRRVEAVLLNSE